MHLFAFVKKAAIEILCNLQCRIFGCRNYSYTEALQPTKGRSFITDVREPGVVFSGYT